MFIIKLIISIVIVLVLAEISKRINPSFGGIIAGLPLGTALSVYFISYQMGSDFLIEAVPWGICGLISSVLFCLLYLFFDCLFKIKNRIAAICVSSFFAILIFFISGYIFYEMNLTVSLSLLVFSAVFILNILILKNMVKIVDQRKKIITPFKNNLFRGLLVGIIIIIITESAQYIGNKWSAILSSFPSTLYPLIIILHYEERNEYYPLVIKGFSLGVSTLVVFYLTCLYLIPIFGLNTGFILIYIISVIYLYLLNKSRRLVQKSFIKPTTYVSS